MTTLMSSSGESLDRTAIRVSGQNELTPANFAAFFRDVHGYEPFPWQQRLTAQVLQRQAWPKVIDLPTGSGKTAVLDTAVYALAVQPAVAPRRIIFVIDRRIVVDQVYERARKIHERVRAGATPILAQIRERLHSLSGNDPLGVAALRGGIPLDADWTLHPDQPWVVVSTVDQFGSRLLFRGYGVSSRMRPIHAGLAGNDCLVILDEVHLSRPFAETLTQVSALHRSARLPQRFATVEMSATPSNVKADRFALDVNSDLEECAELRRRVESVKHAQLVPVGNNEAVPTAVLKVINSLRKGKDTAAVRSVGVVVNRVRTARKTYETLAAKGHDVHLLTGRMRPLDRLDVLERIMPVVDPEKDRCTATGLTIVVATQAIEVGADFSFDALVSECAAIDSLRQRFGRLDRRGTWAERTGCAAQAWIIGPKSVVGSQKPDPIYGESVRVTWNELKRRYNEDGLLNVGANALRDFPSGANAPGAKAPLLLRTHMDAWTQTRPEPPVQPSVDWFLHGIDQDRSADVSILWRWDRRSETLKLVPPRQAELMQIPVEAARKWLADGSEVDLSDVGQIYEPTRTDSPATAQTGDWVRWSGFDDGAESIEVKDIRPGDVIIVDPTKGGLTAGSWDPSSTERVEDLGDAAQSAYGRTATLRLDSRLPYIDSPPTPADESDADTSLAERVAEWLEAKIGEPNQSPNWIIETVRKLTSNFRPTPVGLDEQDSDNGYFILSELHPVTRKQVVDAGIMDGSDEACSYTSTGVTLRQHLDGVGERAGRIAERLGLPDEIAEDIRLAGQLHDLGKVDSRFQAKLVGGDPVELEMRRDEPLAKSLPDARRVRTYPAGMRHEVASVAMIEANADVLEFAHDQDLLLHLVATHHGWGRPLLPIVEDPTPQELSYRWNGCLLKASSELSDTSLALDMADRFWRLVDRYGYHGLAWLETILRLADHQQSAEEAKQL